MAQPTSVKATTAAERTKYHSLQRGLQMLTVLQESGRMRVSDLSERLEIPLSTAYRYAAVLKDSGFAHEFDGFLVASERLAEAGFESPHLVDVAGPVLRRMRRETGLTAVLAVRVHISAVCLDVALAHPTHRISFARGAAHSLYAGASALSLLAYAPAKVITELTSRHFRSYTTATLTPEIIGPYLKQVRQEGVAVSRGQLTPGMIGVAVPVVKDGSCLCSLSLVGDEDRQMVDVAEAKEVLRSGADELLARLDSTDAVEAWLGEPEHDA